MIESIEELLEVEINHDVVALGLMLTLERRSHRHADGGWHPRLSLLGSAKTWMMDLRPP
jgi:hypothetical protein